MFIYLFTKYILYAVAERSEERATAVPGGQDLCQILQDVGDDVYQQYRLTRQGSDFDSQSAFHINVSLVFSHLSKKICNFNNLKNRGLSLPLRLKCFLLMELFQSPPNLEHHRERVSLNPASFINLTKSVQHNLILFVVKGCIESQHFRRDTIL